MYKDKQHRRLQEAFCSSSTSPPLSLPLCFLLPLPLPFSLLFISLFLPKMVSGYRGS